jgi:hypothetical protein
VALTEFVICGMYYEVCVDWPRCFTSRFSSVFVSGSVFNWYFAKGLMQLLCSPLVKVARYRATSV